MLDNVIKEFYTQAAKKFSKLGSLQTIQHGRKSIVTEKIDAAKIKNIMDASIEHKRLVNVDNLFKENVYPKGSPFQIRKLNDRRILTNSDYDTWICDFDEDIIEEFFGKCPHQPIIFYDEALEKLKAEQNTRKNELKNAGIRHGAGVFEHAYFFDSNSTEKKTLSQIIKNANGKKLLWKICRANDVSQVISQFKKLCEMSSFLNEDFNYELAMTCQSIWNNNSKKFPDVENNFDEVFNEISAKYNKKVDDDIVCYTDFSDWRLNDLLDSSFDEVKNSISGIHNKKIEKYIIKLMENRKFVNSLPFMVPSRKRKKLYDEPEFKGIIENYEMLDFDNFLFDITHKNLQLEKDIRYINLIDDYKVLTSKENTYYDELR